MGSWKDMTLGEVVAALRRYQPFLAVVAVILLITLALPGNPTAGPADIGDGEGLATVGDPTTDATGSDGQAAPADGTVPAGDGTSPVGPSGPSPVAPTAGRRTAGATAPRGTPAGNVALAVSDDPPANCDPATGRIKVPSRYAPPCGQAYTGDNGGATWEGVTKDTIRLVWFHPQENPATQAALAAAGADDSNENEYATVRDFVAYFSAHYNLWGRKIDLRIYEGSGKSEDDSVGKADAIRIATEFKPFAVLNAPASNAFVTELTARKILTIGTVSQPIDFYLKNAPYVWAQTLMSSHQGYVHRAEYIAKRLKGRPAKWAGTPTFKTQNRVFGLLWYETPDGAYKSGVDFFKQELAKAGVSLKVDFAFTGANLDPAATQNQARTMIAKMKDEGVTSIIFSGDPLSPAIFTAEADRNQYEPEWILTGSALTDTAIFARTYSKTQWDSAFGLSFLAARVTPAATDPARLHQWHHGRSPTAANTFNVIFANPFIFFTGVHMAGPKLTPASFRDGLFRYPPTGGGATSPLTSWGKHGYWQWEDYCQWDDTTEIWWDNTAQGPDEPGNQGAGLYRYVDNGKRFLPGTHPTSDPRVFDTANTVTIYSERPKDEQPPDYPPPKR